MKYNFTLKLIVIVLSFCFGMTANGQESPQRAEANRLMGEVATALKDKKHEIVIEKSNRILELFPKSNEVLIMRGMAYLQTDKREKELADFTQALNSPLPENLELIARKMKGMLSFQLKKYEQAIAEFDLLLKKTTTEYQHYAYRGRSYFALDKFNEAIADFDQVIKLSPLETDFRRFRAVAFNRVGKYGQAIEDINKELEINDKPNPEVYKIRGFAYRQLGKNELADADEKKYAELTGETIKTEKPEKDISPQEKLKNYLENSQKYFEEGKWELASNEYTKILELIGADAEGVFAILFSRGRCFFELGKLVEALRDYNEVIRLEPTLSGGYIFRGEVYIKQNKLDLALADFNKGLEIDKNEILGYRRRAEVYFLKKDWKNTIKDSDNALKIDSEYRSVYFYRAEAYFELGEYKKALDNMNEYIKRDSGDSDAYRTRAKIHRKLGDEKSALADDKKAEEIEAKNIK